MTFYLILINYTNNSDFDLYYIIFLVILGLKYYFDPSLSNISSYILSANLKISYSNLIITDINYIIIITFKKENKRCK